ncbi:MAG TPA: hypothetical protein VI251_16765 [Pseudolabrys sp.]|jgi:hypothetical protein
MSSIVSASSSSVLNAGSDWIASAWTAMQDTTQNGILGALQDSADGTLSDQVANAANAFATITLNSTSSMSSLIAQIASQTQQDQQQQKLQDSMDALTAQQQMVQPTNVLDPFIYFPDGSTIDTNANIMTMSDGTQFDTTTGAKVVDPTSIIQMANGSYLDTKNNILTMSDGTQIDTVTGIKVSKTA